jgi:branched-chain amino acid transport system substrate-binding protein
VRKLLLVFASCALVANLAFAQEAPPVVRVGTLLDFSGALAEFGPAHQNATEMAAAQINAAAEAVFGGPIIELIHEDSATTPSVGIDRARKLIEVDGVSAIVGSLASGVTVPVAESVTVPAQIPQISPASTSPLLTVLPDNDFLFRTTASDALQGVVAGMLASGEIIEGHSFETAATIFINSPYGQGLSEAFAAAFEARGGQVLAQVAHPEEPQPTYTALLEQALADDPDVLVAIGYPGQATVYLAESRDIFGYTSWQFVDGTKSEEIITAIGAEDLEGLYGTAPGSDPEWPGFQRFEELFEERYGERPPLPFMDSAYDAVAVIGLAIAQAIADGVTDIDGVAIRDRLRTVANPPGEVVSVGEFEEAFRLIQMGEEITYNGAASPVEFDENGDIVSWVEIWQFAGGTMETLEVIAPDEIPEE